MEQVRQAETRFHILQFLFFSSCEKEIRIEIWGTEVSTMGVTSGIYIRTRNCARALV